jgi:DNA-binding FrmR family transcriptional regulator
MRVGVVGVVRAMVLVPWLLVSMTWVKGTGGGVGHDLIMRWPRSRLQAVAAFYTQGGYGTFSHMAATDTALGRGQTRGYTASKDQLQNRLRRIEGQVRGIQRMVDEDRWCPDILTQIAAVQGALDRVALGLADDHARHCVLEGPEESQPERTHELMAAVGRLVRRG